MEFITYLVEQYAYLALAIAVCLPWLVLFALRKKERPVLLIASIFGAVLGPISEWFYFQDYWYPPSLLEWQLGPFRVLLEDALFGFAVIGVASVLVPYTAAVVPELRLRGLAKAIADWALVGVTTLVLFVFGLNSIFAASIAMAGVGLLLLIQYRKHLVAALSTGIIFGFIMFSIYAFGSWLFPLQAQQFYATHWMLHGTEAGVMWFGVAVTEILFAAVAGLYIAVWARVRLVQ